MLRVNPWKKERTCLPATRNLSVSRMSRWNVTVVASFKQDVPMPEPHTAMPSRDRFVKAQEIAVRVSWLASEDCSFSADAVFDISGGRATC